MHARQNNWWPRRTTISRICYGLSLTIVALLIWLTAFATSFLYVEHEPVPVDAIVVLGGEPGDRPFRALELFKRGLAREVIVVGAGDCQLIHDRLALAGVPREQLTTECASRSTMDNALFARQLLDRSGARSAIIVTSWFHSRRALSCFRGAAPHIRTQSVPSYHGVNMKGKPSVFEIPHVIAEYAKVAWYLARYKIELVDA